MRKTPAKHVHVRTRGGGGASWAQQRAVCAGGGCFLLKINPSPTTNELANTNTGVSRPGERKISERGNKILSHKALLPRENTHTSRSEERLAWPQSTWPRAQTQLKTSEYRLEQRGVSRFYPWQPPETLPKRVSLVNGQTKGLGPAQVRTRHKNKRNLPHRGLESGANENAQLEQKTDTMSGLAYIEVVTLTNNIAQGHIEYT